MDERLRVWRWARQGLDGSLAGAKAAAVLERAGWVRSVGGASPYLALFARSGASRPAVDAEVAKLAIHELPSARGCTYVVPAAEFGLALRASVGQGDAATLAMARKYLGVTDAEIAKLSDKILAAVAETPLEPRELKDELGDAVRNLGAEGKKRGTTTTLPLALALLQTSGRIRRVPTDGRLDQQRYRYVAWKPTPVCALSEPEVAVELARRFFRWAGPGTVAQLAWWAGLGAKSARAAVAALGLVPFADGDERVVAAEDLAAIRATRMPKEPSVTLVPLLDNLSHARREVAGLLEAEDAKVKLYDAQGARPGGSLVDLPHHAIVDRGRIIGFWEYDVAAEDGHGAIAWSTFASTGAAAKAAAKQAVARTEAFVREQLGDARSFSLDAPDTRGPRIAAVQKYGR
jgi:hypothetical protein